MIENSDFRIEEPDLSSRYDVDLIRRFMAPMGFYFDESGIDYSIILYNLNDEIVGVGSCEGKILKYIAVSPQFRETGAFAHIVSHLTEYVMAGNQQVFVFTRPENICRFTGLGYQHVASAEPLIAVLEFGYKSIDDYKKYLLSIKQDSQSDTIAALVVNCNPFTYGHQYLIEKAAEENDLVYVFVVETERSTFSFKDRFEMIRRGTAHLSNIVLVQGGEYIVSGATFPNYFLKNEKEDAITQKQAELDIEIFGTHIAPLLGIKKRYVGTEDYCATTALYNKAMKQILPSKGIHLIEVQRKETVINGSEEFISASKVREILKNNNHSQLKNWLPQTTLDYLENIKDEMRSRLKSDGRH